VLSLVDSGGSRSSPIRQPEPRGSTFEGRSNGRSRQRKLEGLWFHDLRRSFVTRARKHRIPETVVMRMSGHRTRAVFETARPAP